MQYNKIDKPQDSHFMAILVVGIVIVALIYLAYHNKAKLVGKTGFVQNTC